MNTTTTEVKEEVKPSHKSQEDGQGEDIDVGMFDTGMTTICSPRYNTQDDDEHQINH